MIVRRERPGDVPAVQDLVGAAFTAPPGRDEPVEVTLLDRLRSGEDWIGELSLVAERDGVVVGHVLCSRARIGDAPALGLGPVAVRPDRQREGIGTALMHAVLGAAEALGEPVVVLLGHREYYPRFGFVPALSLGVEPPEAAWGEHFMARAFTPDHPRGAFRYSVAFDGL